MTLTDIYGREIGCYVNKTLDAGNYQVEINVKEPGLSDGVYYYTLAVDENITTRNMSVVK